MNKDLAKKLMNVLSASGEPLNKAAELIEQISDEEERAIYRKAIATILAGIYTELEFKIIKQYPELDPDKN